MSKARMTFRFDQEHRSVGGGLERKPKEQQVIPLHQDEYKVTQQVTQIDAQTINPYTNDFGGWQSSFDTETLRVEKLIRESGNSVVPPNITLSDNGEIPVSNEGFRVEHTDPLQDHRWYVPEETVYVRKKLGASWFKVAASVAGAVATGAAFGFLVLSMFTGDTQSNQAAVTGSSPPGAAAAATAPKSGLPDKAVAVTDAAAAGSPVAKANGNKALAVEPPASMAVSAAVAGSAVTAVTAVTSVNIPARTLTLLQSGVFSTSQGADAAQTELKKQGLAAVSDIGDKYPVYVALALTRDEALGVVQQFQQKKIEVIVKNVELPALSRMKWSGKAVETMSPFILQGDKLVQMIAPLTLTHLSESKLSAIDAPTLQAVKTAHQTWIGMTAGVNEGISEEGKAAVRKINTAMNTAVASLDEYKKNPSASILWQTQNALMQAVLAQKELRRVIAAP
jgi:stage II sporulation protein B